MMMFVQHLHTSNLIELQSLPGEQTHSTRTHGLTGKHCDKYQQAANKRPGRSRQLTVRQMMAVTSWLLTAASSFRQAPVEKFQICMHNIVCDV